eukprot:jgi/Hompol1/2493/HPOL_002928-RA
MLKELNVLAVGQRITFLREIYASKVRMGIPFQDGDFVPEIRATVFLIVNCKICDIRESEDHLLSLLSSQASTIESLQKSVQELSGDLQRLREELEPLKKRQQQQQQNQGRLLEQKETGLAPLGLANTSLTDLTAGADSPGQSDYGAIRIFGDRLPNRENELFKGLRIYISDNCATTIENILKKYKVVDDAANYALVVRSKTTCR